MLLNHYRNRLRVTLGSSAAPYGYTLATWTSGAVLANASGVPNAVAALTFMVGAVLGFALVGALAFGGVTKHFDRDHGETPSCGEASIFCPWLRPLGEHGWCPTSSKVFSPGP